MDQSRLREFEFRCIQEEPPFCQAACPLHVDARGVHRLLAQGKAAEARKLLARTMPLTGALGRICDHPCEAVCRRKDVDAAIRIHEIERALVRHAPASATPLGPRQPSRGKSVAVLGSGMSGLVAAHDLARKGVAVTVFHQTPAPGGELRDLPPELLPPEVLDAEIAALRALGIIFEAVPAIGVELLDQAEATFDAVYVALDEGLPAVATLAPEPLALRTARPTVFAGGRSPSHIFRAADGRRAAMSIDRLFQNVSLEASREREGPFETRLFTSVEGVQPAAPRAMANPLGYDLAEAQDEAGRCLDCQCLECVKVCAYLERPGGYPKKYAREIYNNLAVVHGVRRANRFINSCSDCGLCAAVCPNDFHMGELCLESRRELVAANKMPPSAHGFALADLAFNRNEAAALSRPDPGKPESAYAFWPGCQLGGSSPDLAFQSYAHLRDVIPKGVGIILTCCGAPARWAGREELLSASLDELRAHWDALGRPTLICACSTCLATLAESAPDLPATSLWEVLAERGFPASAERLSAEPVAFHDPCSSRHLPAARAAVRTILERLGQPVEELRLSGELTECCGYGGHMDAVDPELAETVARRRVEGSPREIAVACAMCRDQLSRPAFGNKPVRHLLEALFPDSPDSAPRPAPQPLVRSGPPGFADRHENRARLKNRLLAEVFGEATRPADAGAAVALDPAATPVIDARRILLEDVAAVVRAAEESGKRFVNATTGHTNTGRFLACLAPAAVTYWAEYEPVETGGFRVTRAWSHRMRIIGHSDSTSNPQRFPELMAAYAEWRCGRCGGQLETVQTRLEYLGSVFDVELPGCRACGASLVFEELALGKMLEVERILEDK